MKVMSILFPHKIMNLPFHPHFQEGPIVNVETSEERLKEMNLHKVHKKVEELSPQEYDKDRTL